MIVCKTFFFTFMTLLAALIVKNNHILTEIYFNVLEKHPGPNLKGFQYQIWISVIRPEK